MYNCEIVKIAKIRYRDHGDYEDNEFCLEIGSIDDEDELKNKIIEKMKNFDKLVISGELIITDRFTNFNYSVEEFYFTIPWGGTEEIRHTLKTYFIEINEVQKINGRYYKLLPYENQIF